MNEYKVELLSKLVMDGIKNGVIIDGVKRDFDLVDYYKITKLNLSQFFGIAQSYLSIDDLKLLRGFVLKYGYLKRIKDCDLDSEIYDSTLILGAKFDENGKYITNSGVKITMDQKKNAISYLKENKLPVTLTTYKLVIKGILTNEIDSKSIKTAKNK